MRVFTAGSLFWEYCVSLAYVSPPGGGDFLMSGIWICATDQSQFFTFKNLEQAPHFELFSRAGPTF